MNLSIYKKWHTYGHLQKQNKNFKFLFFSSINEIYMPEPVHCGFFDSFKSFKTNYIYTAKVFKELLEQLYDEINYNYTSLYTLIYDVAVYQITAYLRMQHSIIIIYV